MSLSPPSVPLSCRRHGRSTAGLIAPSCQLFVGPVSGSSRLRGASPVPPVQFLPPPAEAAPGSSTVSVMSGIRAAAGVSEVDPFLDVRAIGGDAPYFGQMPDPVEAGPVAGAQVTAPGSPSSAFLASSEFSVNYYIDISPHALGTWASFLCWDRVSRGHN